MRGNTFHMFYDEYCVLLIDKRRSNKKKQIIKKLFPSASIIQDLLPFGQEKQSPNSKTRD